MLRNLFLRFGKRPSTDLDTERSVCGKASPSTTPSRASHDVSIPILVVFSLGSKAKISYILLRLNLEYCKIKLSV
jgi:hypothetical protein